jgi:hypothetical protein
VAERPPPPWGPTGDGSKGLAARFADFRSAIGRSDPVALTVTVLGVAAAVLLVISEFTTIASVDVASGSCEVINDANPDLADRCSLSGFERHGGALVLLGLLTALMAWGAGMGASRPAAIALTVIGVLVVGIALLLDLPVTDDTGAIGRNFEGAEGKIGAGLYVEIVAGGLAGAAGVRRLRAKAPG